MAWEMQSGIPVHQFRPDSAELDDLDDSHVQMEVSKVMVGYPRLSSIYRWIFHEINHPAFGMPPFCWSPQMENRNDTNNNGMGTRTSLGNWCNSDSVWVNKIPYSNNWRSKKGPLPVSNGIQTILPDASRQQSAWSEFFLIQLGSLGYHGGYIRTVKHAFIFVW